MQFFVQNVRDFQDFENVLIQYEIHQSSLLH